MNAIYGFRKHVSKAMVRHRYYKQEQLQSEERTNLHSLQAGQDKVRI